MKRLLFGLALAALVSSPLQTADACELRGTFVGYQAAGQLAGIEFVVPVLDDAGSTCSSPVAVMPSPMMEQWVVGTPHLQLGHSYAFTLREGGALGTHLVVDADLVSGPVRTTGLRLPMWEAPLLKSGDGQPPCTVGAWRSDLMPVPLEVYSAGSADVDDGSDLEAIQAAAAEWYAPSGAAAAFTISLYDEPVDRAVDGRSTFAFVDAGAEIFDSLGPENLGFTCVVCDEEGFIIEADVRLNGLDRTWSTACNGAGFDVFGATLHELGHVLGMVHSEDLESVMFPVTSARRLLDLRTLSRGDVQALSGLYPCGDESCGGPSQGDDGCPVGAALCEWCLADSECGAVSDLCVIDRVTGASLCARECSGSFPCPAGFECVNTGSDNQCVPVAGACPAPEQFVGCACEVDSECGGVNDVCLDARCASACGSGLGCPEESQCTNVLDSEGLPLGQFCLPNAELDPCTLPPSEAGCGRCGASDGGGLWFGFALAGITLARRRVLMASRCR